MTIHAIARGHRTFCAVVCAANGLLSRSQGAAACLPDAAGGGLHRQTARGV
jgi:hypothetical protein